MAKVTLRKSNRERRKIRIRGKVSGTASRPRLSVFRSNKYVSAQIIDDVSGKTLVSASGAKDAKAAFETGKQLAAAAKDAKISEVVFDRNGYTFHGRIKSLAEGAREGGLKF